MNFLALWIALGVLLFGLIIMVVISKKKKTWYKVELANPEMSEANIYRTGWDTLWRSDEAGIMMFHRENGKSVRMGKHWIIKIEEL